MLKITEGTVNRALKVVIYGSEGIGKTTIASKFPNPLFIDTEGGTSQLNVRRIDRPQSWEELLDIIKEVAANPDICQTLVLDTADWAERLAVDKVCRDYNITSIESANYGKGYVYLAEEFDKFLKKCDSLIDAGINIVMTAHAKMRKFEQPDEQGAYDRWELKLSKQVAPLIKEWCDMLLFVNYKTYVVTTENKTKKAQGGKRVIYTAHHPCWDAKNRHGLPDEMELDFKNLEHLFTAENTAPKPQKQSEPTAEKPIDKLHALMKKNGVTETEIQQIVSDKGHYPIDTPISNYSDKFIKGWLIKHWGKILEMIIDTKLD